jgi:aspartyl/asparaginyl beta-hydroxylase (cupin superfamily)
LNATPISEAEARALADAIEQVSETQSPDAASKLVEMALARAPRQPMVLNAAGGHMLKTGKPRRARELFDQAIAGNRDSKVLWFNLATACRALGDTKSEAEALEQALAIEPRYVVALLHKADLMQRLAQPKAAALLYQAALDSVASGAPAPRQAAGALARAQEQVLTTRRELEQYLETEVAPARALHAAADQHRFDACRDVYLRKRPVYHSYPKELLFPYLPGIEFFPRKYFPWLDALEAATEDIAAEALAALAGDRAGFRPYVDFPPGTPIDQWGPLNHSLDWSVYPLWHDSAPIRDHQQKCPKTTAVLSQLPMCDIPGWSPGAFFSVLKPHTHLPPHTGTSNVRSIVHLPLVIPAGCRFRVGVDARPWQRGTAWVFDDCIEHEAWNDSDKNRIILIFDIWNPLLSAAERDLMRALLVGIHRYYGPDGPQLGSR